MDFDRKTLIRAAMKARTFSYAPFSNFHVGAALLTRDGEIITGCNIENSAYSPTICAERCAIAKAISEGKREFIAIAIVGPEDNQTTPCGVCRQTLYEFCDESLVILCGGTEENYMETTLGALLPKGFRL
jgi:cytidine deaminase